jgi:hypothetical protein
MEQGLAPCPGSAHRIVPNAVAELLKLQIDKGVALVDVVRELHP